MPPERNTRSIVEVPELFVCGLLHESDCPPPARLGRIQPRHAIEHHLVVLGRKPRAEVSLKWYDLGGRRDGQECQDRQRSAEKAQ
jgi:hypothetical protein